MAIYELTTFVGTTLASANRHQVAYSDSTTVYSRMGTLENGAIFDADGTSDADTTLGQIRARYLCTPTSTGAVALNSHLATFEGIAGKVGTLTGKAVGSPDTVKTCTARCIEVTVEEYNYNRQATLTASNKLHAFVDVVWQKKTEWQ